jgi:ABC-type sugar transport system ATPase subunit
MSLALERVAKAFGTTHALQPLSLTVADGETLTVVGPSGAGKTTLLRAIAGLERIDAGRITIGERDVTKLEPAPRNVAYVFQDFALFPHMSVRANIGFGVSARARAARVATVAQYVGVAHLLDRRPATLSGGERQRVALARALAIDPTVMLFDEPFASLDAPLRARLRIELAEMRAQSGLPAVFVTHDQGEALALGDRVAVLAGGALVALDRPARLLADPPSAFVAGFLGTPPANVIAGRAGDGRFVADDVPSLVCDGVAAAVTAIGIRPERVRVDDAGTVTARVRFIETLGDRRYATTTCGTTTLCVLAGDRTEAGAIVRLCVDWTGAWWFDAQGQRVR